MIGAKFINFTIKLNMCSNQFAFRQGGKGEEQSAYISRLWRDLSVLRPRRSFAKADRSVYKDT